MVQQLTRSPVVQGQWIPMTWEEFLAWSPQGQSEWVDGEGIAYVSTSTRHGDLLEFLGMLIGVYLRVFGLGRIYTSQTLMRLPSRRSGRMPDIMVVRMEHLDRLRDKWLEGPADFVVEFVSDDDPDRDLVVKHAEFEREGVPEYLTIDSRPNRDDVRLRQLHSDGRYHIAAPDELGRIHSQVLPGFWLDPVWFQQDPLPNPMTILRRVSPEAWRRLVEEVEAES